ALRERQRRYLDAHEDRGTTAVRLDGEFTFERFAAGPEVLGDDVDRERDVLPALEDLLRRGGGAVADRQPVSVGAQDGAVEQAGTLVFQVQDEAVVTAAGYLTEVDFERLGEQFGRLAAGTRQ